MVVDGATQNTDNNRASVKFDSGVDKTESIRESERAALMTLFSPDFSIWFQFDGNITTHTDTHTYTDTEAHLDKRAHKKALKEK